MLINFHRPPLLQWPSAEVFIDRMFDSGAAPQTTAYMAESPSMNVPLLLTRPFNCRPPAAGPWRSRQLAMGGEAAAAELRRRFLEAFPDPGAPLSHSPCARLVVLRKKREARGPAAAL